MYNSDQWNEIIEKSIASIDGFIAKDQKHISILMPTGTGLIQLLLHTAQFYLEKGKTAAIITMPSILKGWMTSQVSQFNLQYSIRKAVAENLCYMELLADRSSKTTIISAECETSDDVLNCDIIFLFDLNAFQRDQLMKIYQNDRSSVILSFGSLPYTKNPGWRSKIPSFMDSLSAIVNSKKMEPIIISTGSFFDIRDYQACTHQEWKFIIDQARAQDELCFDKEYVIRQEKENSTDAATIEKLEAQLNAVRLERNLYRSILRSEGHQVSELNYAYDQMMRLYDQYEDKMINADDSVNEKLLSEFETEAARYYLNSMHEEIRYMPMERYIEILSGYLGTKVWKEQLCENSRKNLIASRLCYDTCRRMMDEADTDYTGVCMLLTKTVDIELTKRFYTDYIVWLSKKYPLPENSSKWPGSLLNEDKDAPIQESRFTLGSVAWVLGINRHGRIKDIQAERVASEYAAEFLYPNDFTPEQIESKLKDIVETTETIRFDYRNPAAHREKINEEQAKACMEYMIDRLRKLRFLLEDMNC